MVPESITEATAALLTSDHNHLTFCMFTEVHNLPSASTLKLQQQRRCPSCPGLQHPVYSQGTSGPMANTESSLSGLTKVEKEAKKDSDGLLFKPIQRALSCGVHQNSRVYSSVAEGDKQMCSVDAAN